MKVIEVTVANDGSTRVETKGFSGAECQHRSRFLESALGRRIEESLTLEFYETAREQNRVSETN